VHSVREFNLGGVKDSVLSLRPEVLFAGTYFEHGRFIQNKPVGLGNCEEFVA